MKKLLVFLFCIYAISVAQSVNRIEPPFWWSNMKNTELQIMFYGENIGSFNPQLHYKGVKISKVVKSDNNNYLWVYVNISREAKPGNMTFLFNNHDTPIEINYELKERESKFVPAEINASDAVYLVTPDRFANGDKANDMVEPLLEGINRDKPFGRHGGDLKGIIEHLDYIKKMGFTAIWPMPVLQNNQRRFSYHGYSITDFYNIDLRYGGNDGYLEFVRQCHAKGLKVIQDVVFNQIGDNHWWMQDIPANNWFHTWRKFTNSNFTGEVIPDPNASIYDRKQMLAGWFDRMMPDMNQKNPELATYLIQHTIFWIEYAKLDGIRLDTYQYNYKEFMNIWVKRVQEEYPGFFIVGEVWLSEPSLIAYWKKGTNFHDGFSSELEAITDFPIQKAIEDVYGKDKDIRNLYRIVSQDFLYNNANTNLIFADNHDVTRLYTLVNGDMKKFKQVITLITTMRGIPQIYYGTEILMEGRHHGVLRADYPGGWEGDLRNAFTYEGRTDSENEAWNYIAKLFNWRKNKSVIHDGKLIHFIPHKNVYVYFRQNDDDCVMVVINKGNEAFTVTNRFDEILAKHSAGKEILSGREYSDLYNIKVESGNSAVIELR